MPARARQHDFHVSKGMGARFELQFPSGTDLSSAGVTITIKQQAPNSGSYFLTSADSTITVDDANDKVTFAIEPDTTGVGGDYQDIAIVGTHHYKIEILLAGVGTPDYRIQGLWIVEEDDGPLDSPCQDGDTLTLRFDTFVVQLRFD